MPLTVPFLDLHSQLTPLRDEIDASIRRVVDSCQFVLGEDVKAFEAEFAEYCDVPYTVGVDSGTSALTLVLRALEIGPGDEVILPPNSFIATAESVSLVGARPVFADVDEDTQLIDPDAVRNALTSRTRAVIAVHLFGRTADLGALTEITERQGIHLIEDAAQAHGARSHGRRVGSVGVAGAFSFYPSKNLGAFGDAGGVTTRDPALRDVIRSLRDHGQVQKNTHERVGQNTRLDTLQAAVLRVKLRALDSWNTERQRLASRYTELLGDSEFKTPAPLRPGEDHVYHLYVVRHAHRASVVQSLLDQRIGHAVHYPVPIHLTPAYAHLGQGPGRFPNSERLAREVLSLPLYPGMNDKQVEHVCNVLTRSSIVTG